MEYSTRAIVYPELKQASEKSSRAAEVQARTPLGLVSNPFKGQFDWGGLQGRIWLTITCPHQIIIFYSLYTHL